jgi:DNA-binding response OmpR family regulator
MRITVLAARLHQLDLYARWLLAAGHSVYTFSHPRGLLSALSCNQSDALLLDGDGVEIVDWALMRQVRLLTSIPALVVSPDASEHGVVSTLRAGADDYLLKPVRRKELLARLESITRPREQPKDGRLEIGGLRVDFNDRTVSLHHVKAQLTGKDFDLAALFLLNVGRLMSRSQIAHTIWAQEPGCITGTMNTHVCRLRCALSLWPSYGWRLTPIYGRGYRLEKCAPSTPGPVSAPPRLAPASTVTSGRDF